MKIIKGVVIAASGSWTSSRQQDGYRDPHPYILSEFDIDTMARLANHEGGLPVQIGHDGEVVGRIRKCYTGGNPGGAALLMADIEVLDDTADLIDSGHLTSVSHTHVFKHGELWSGLHLEHVALLTPKQPPAISYCKDVLSNAKLMAMPPIKEPAPRKRYVPFSDPAHRRRAVANFGTAAVERMERLYAPKVAAPLKIDRRSN